MAEAVSASTNTRRERESNSVGEPDRKRRALKGWLVWAFADRGRRERDSGAWNCVCLRRGKRREQLKKKPNWGLVIGERERGDRTQHNPLYDLVLYAWSLRSAPRPRHTTTTTMGTHTIMRQRETFGMQSAFAGEGE